MNKYLSISLLFLTCINIQAANSAQGPSRAVCPPCPPASAVFCNLCAGTGVFTNLVVQNDLTLCKGLVISATAPAPCVVTGCTGSLTGALVVDGGVAIGENLTVCGPINSNSEFDEDCIRILKGEAFNLQVGWNSGDVEYGADNTFVGYNAGHGISAGGTGTDNASLGYNALGALTIGTGNVGIGSEALANTTFGNLNTVVGFQADNANIGNNRIVAVGAFAAQNNVVDNTVAVGFEALRANGGGVAGAGGDFNTAVGYQALLLNTYGNHNVAVGSQSLEFNTVGTENIGVGQLALQFNTSGDSNVAVGTAALQSNNGFGNTAVGHLAMTPNISGNSNVAVGLEAMVSFNAGDFNVAVGRQAMGNFVGEPVSGDDNVACGAFALAYNQGSENTACGSFALQGNGSGFNNTAVGSSAMSFAITGATGVDNTAVGANAMSAAGTQVNENAVVGAGAGLFLGNLGIGGNNNSILGSNAGSDIQGNNNVAIGFNAGTFVSDGNVIVGANAQATFYTGCIVLGTNAVANESNLLVMGAAAPYNLLTSATATAGAASALPATPQLYLLVRLNNGTTLKIPCYNV